MPHTSPTPLPRRTTILRAAEEVFAEKGFAGAGVDEIARRARVNKAMLYYHVGDKAQLYKEVVLSFLVDVEREVDANLAGAGTPADKLAGFQRALMSVALRRPEYPRIVLRELSAGGVNLPPEVIQRLVRLLGRTRGIVAEGRAAGQFRAVDPVLTHLLVVGSVLFFANAVRLRDRFVEEGADLPDLAALPDAAARLTDIVLFGIATGRTEGGRP